MWEGRGGGHTHRGSNEVGALWAMEGELPRSPLALHPERCGDGDGKGDVRGSRGPLRPLRLGCPGPSP